MEAPEHPYVPYADYLAAEATSEHKHEYVAGRVLAMAAGGSPEHAAVAAAVVAELSHALRGRPCRVYSSDLRVRVEASDLSTYPDVTVTCGTMETSERDPDAIVNPVVLVEVLSPSTEARDRGQKFADYRRIPSLGEYLLVSQTEPHIERFWRDAGGVWRFDEVRADEVLVLASPCVEGVALDLAHIYRDPLKAS